MVKRVLSGIIIGVMLTGITPTITQARSVDRVELKKDSKESNKKDKDKSSKKKKKNKKKSKSKEAVDFSKVITVNGILQPPDSIGNIYFTGSFKNNTGMPVTYVSLKYTYKEASTGDKLTTYLTCYDTILPEEESAIYDCFGGEDMKPISIDFKVIDKKDKEHYFSYDYKLDKVEQLY